MIKTKTGGISSCLGVLYDEDFVKEQFQSVLAGAGAPEVQAFESKF